MSQQALKAAANAANGNGSAAQGTAIAKERPTQTIAQLLTNPATKQQLALAMPKHMTADRLARIALTEVRKVPKLATCDQMSFLGAIMQCAQLGLEPGGALGHVYLLPFDKKQKVGNVWKVVKTEVQVIVGYRGMIDLARRSGQIQSLEARAVYAKDDFRVELGLDSNIVHNPAWHEVDRGPLTFVYAVAKLKDGGIQFDVMSRAEIEKVRARSKAADSGPWVTDFDEMAKKTVVRRLFKYLPVSIEMQHAVGLDEQAAAGLSQDNALVIDADYAHVSTRDEEHEALEHDAAGEGEQQQLEQQPANGQKSEGSAPITLHEVAAKLRGASTLDALDDAASSISLLEAKTQREAAQHVYTARRAELGGK